MEARRYPPALGRGYFYVLAWRPAGPGSLEYGIEAARVEGMPFLSQRLAANSLGFPPSILRKPASNAQPHELAFDEECVPILEAPRTC